MKSLVEFIHENETMILTSFIYEQRTINEKLSLGDKFSKFIAKYLYNTKAYEQHECAKYIKKEADNLSDGQIGTSVIKVKEIESKMSNCINAKDEVIRPSGKDTLEDSFKKKIFWNDIELREDTPFVCFYSKEDKDKFYVWPESPWFFCSKDNKGNRPLLAYPNLTHPDEENTDGNYLKNYVFPRILDPEKWKEEQKAKKKEIQKNYEARIKHLEDELNKLKKDMEN